MLRLLPLIIVSLGLCLASQVQQCLDPGCVDLNPYDVALMQLGLQGFAQVGLQGNATKEESMEPLPNSDSQIQMQFQERHTKLVSTYGIMMSMAVHPYLPVSDTAKLSMKDYRELMSVGNLSSSNLMQLGAHRTVGKGATAVNSALYLKTMSMHENPSVYVIGTALPSFIKEVLPFVKDPFVLVTGDSDQAMPGQFPGKFFHDFQEFKRFIEDSRVLHWFAQNGNVDHPKFTTMPIGLDYHTLFRKVAPGDGHSWGGHATPQEQENELEQILAGAQPWSRRKPRIFACFSNSDSSRLSVERQLKNGAEDATIIDWKSPSIPRHEFWQEASQYQFVLSPRGNGEDCHRTWEALALGAIPIVASGPLDSMWQGTKLPVYTTTNWGELRGWREEDAAAKGAALRKKAPENQAALQLNYWKQLINTARQSS